MRDAFHASTVHSMTSRTIPAQFPNLLSRLLLTRSLKRQFVLPDAPHPLIERFLMRYERRRLRIDLDSIDVDRPIFVLGLPRSGTTLLQDLCCAHPAMAYVTNAMHQYRRCFCAAETIRRRWNLNFRAERYLGDSVEIEAGSPNEALGFCCEWFGWDMSDPHYVPRQPGSYTAEEITRIRETIRRVLWCFGPEPRRFFLKNPLLLTEIPRLTHYFPDAKIIHLVRDPRQCANSLCKLYRLELAQLQRRGGRNRPEAPPFIPYPRVAKLPEYLRQWGPDSVITTAHLWNDSITTVHAALPCAPSFLEIRYEDLVATPQRVMTKVFDFCELPLLPDDETGFRSRLKTVGKIHHTNDYGSFDAISEICRELMQQLGYQ
jgi:hypothetical protein